MNLKMDGLAQDALLDSDKVNNGVWVHLDSANLDENGVPLKMYLGGNPAKPQRALVRSNRCQLIKDAEASQQRTSMTKIRLAKRAERNKVIAESSALPDEVRFAYQLAALENFSAEGGIQQVSLEDGKTLFAMTSLDYIVQQVREVAFDDSQYLATAETEAGKPSPSTLTTAKTEADPT